MQFLLQHKCKIYNLCKYLPKVIGSQIKLCLNDLDVGVKLLYYVCPNEFSHFKTSAKATPVLPVTIQCNYVFGNLTNSILCLTNEYLIALFI